MEQPHYSTQPHYMGHPLKEIPHPHPHDVLCGRGGGTNAHIGNSHWRMLVAANKELYCSLPKKQKMLLSKSIVNAVRSQNPPGRFLQKDSHSELWYDVGDQRATEKTSQALREGAPEIRTKLKEPAKGTGGSATTGPSTTPAATTASTPPTPVQPVASSSSASSYRSVPQPPQGAPQPPPPPMRPMVPTSSGLYVPAPPPHHIMPPLVDRHASGLALPAPVPAQGPVPQRSRSKKMESSSGGASSAPGPSSGAPGASSGAPGAPGPSQPYHQQEHPQHPSHHPSQQQYHQQPRYPSAQQAPPPQHYPQQQPPYQKPPQQQQPPYPPRQGQYDFEPMPFHPVDSSVPTLRQEASQQPSQPQQQHMRPPVHTPNPSQFGSYREPSQPSYEETGTNAGGAAFPEPPTGLDDNGGFSFGSIVMTDAEEMRLRQNYSLGTGTAPKRPSGSEPPGNHNNPASSGMSNNNNGNSHSDKQDRDAALPTTVAPPDGGLQDIGTSFGSMMSIGTAPKLDANGGFSFGSAMSFSVNAAAVTAVDGGLEAIGTSFGSLSLATNDRQRMLGDNNKHANDDDDEAAAGAVPTFLQQHKSKGNLLDCTDSEDSDQEESASAAAASRNKSLEYEKLKATLEERKYAPATMMPPPLIGGGGPTTSTSTTSRSSHSYYGAPPTHSLNIPAPSFDRDFSQMSAISVGDDDFQHYPPVIPYGGASGGNDNNNNNGFSSDMPPPPPAMRKGDADDVWRDDSGDLEPFDAAYLKQYEQQQQG